MFKNLNRFALMAMMAVAVVACDDTVTPDPDPIPDNSLVRIEGEITSNLTLDATKKYLLVGKVFVQAPNTITIPAGTVIFGDKDTKAALIINRGAKIIANGTATNPIVFTSEAPAGFRNRGDWAGIVICGNALTNGNANSTIEGIAASTGENGVYGPGAGAAINDQNSGSMKFVRIEFAGVELSPDNELNSLTMGSVGSGTTIDNIMVSYGNDDAYEWFGGTNNHNYLIAYSTWDDDFDSDRGYAGKVQFGLIVRDPNIADKSGSRAFEASSNSNASATPHSLAEFANITVMGPRVFNTSINANYQAGVEINSNSAIKVRNSIVAGWSTGARFNGSGADANITGTLFFRNTANSATGGGASLPANYATNNVLLADSNISSTVWAAAPSLANPNPLLGANSGVVATGAPALTGFPVSPAYHGAFGTSADAGWNWTSGWIEWNPISKAY